MFEPVNCTLTMVGSADESKSAFPAFTVAYPDDEAIQILQHTEVVLITRDKGGEDDVAAVIRLKYIRHVSCKCGYIPESNQIGIVTSVKSADGFFKELDRTQCFFWILSLPSHEIRLLVNCKTNSVVDKNITSRVVH